MESQLSEERMKLEWHLTKACDKNGSREEARLCITNRLNQICSHFLPHFVHADTLAKKYQRSYTRGSTMIYMLAAFAVVVASAQALFLPHVHFLVLIEILLIVSVIGVIKFGNYKHWHRNWQDSRLLAERLRHAVFLAMIDQPVVTHIAHSPFYCKKNAEHPANKAFLEIWRNWEQKSQKFLSSNDYLTVIKDFLLNAWLEDQRDWHNNNTKIHKLKHSLLSRSGEILFYLTLGAAVLHFSHIAGSLWGKWWTFLSISCPALGAAFGAMRNHFEHNKLFRRSEQMVIQLDDIIERMRNADDMNPVRKIAEDAERLMMGETVDWYALICSKILDKPV